MLDVYATLAELRRLDGLDNTDRFDDATLIEARAVAVERVELYTGVAWSQERPPPVSIRWAVRTVARQWVTDLDARLPDRATSIVSEFGTQNLAQAGGPWRPTSLPEVNAVLNSYRARPPFG
ncbi:MAG: hypothetical protein ABIQ18_39840 [Umezawaea sp.]